MKRKFNVVGMSCMHCQKAVKNALEENEKIHDSKVDLQSGEVEITCDESLTLDEIVEIVEKAGYKVN